MDLRDHFRVIWRRKWPILAIAVLVAVLVYVSFGRQAPVYQAKAQLSVTPGQVSAGSGQTQSDTLFLAATYAQLGDTAPVVMAAVREAHLPLDEQTAARRLTITASTSVGFISVTATGPSPAAAVALTRGEADALTAAVTAEQEAALFSQLKKVDVEIAATSAQLAAAPPGSPQLATLQAQLQAQDQLVSNRQSQPFDEVNVVGPARGNNSPVSPQPKKYALLGFVTALVVDSELAVLIEALSDRFPAERLEDEVVKTSGLPVLAHIPEGDAGTVTVTEAFRKVRTGLMFMAEAQDVQTVAVVGAEPGAGKSFVSVNLARAVSELGDVVVLIDGDMRRPVIHDRIGVARTPGLSEVLAGARTKLSLRTTPAYPNMMIMPAGEIVADPSALLGHRLASHVLVPVLKQSRTTELVVIDTPPEALFPDALTIAAQCDVTIVVVDARTGRRRALRRTLADLRQVGAKPFGVVLNRSTAGTSEDATNYYGVDRAPIGYRRIDALLTSLRRNKHASNGRLKVFPSPAAVPEQRVQRPANRRTKTPPRP